MVTNEDISYLKDIQIAIRQIENYTIGLDWKIFEGTDIVIDATCRQLEIIGEAVGRLSPEFIEEHHQMPWSKMIGMRHRLIHGYGEVDNEVVWETTQENLPELKQLIETIIK